MTHLEISKKLAMAIGWPFVTINSGICEVRDGADYFLWSHFDYREWSVAGPIAERFDAFPLRSCMPGEWCSTYEGNDMRLAYADTPQKAIAMAVINGATK